LIYIHSHHKCASRWAIEYMREVSRLNALSFWHSDYTADVAPRRGNIAFFGNSSYERAARKKLGGIHIVRNPLDILVSAYFSHRNTHPEDGWPELTRQRALLKRVGLEEGLYLTVIFLERSDINTGAVGPLFALRNWDYDDPRFTTVRTEDFVARPAATVQALAPFADLKLPSDDRFTFEAVSGGRKRGEVNTSSHYRSGAPNQWKTCVPAALISYAQTYLAPLLRRYYPEVQLHNQVLDRPFYELDENTRIALGNSAVASHRTILERWTHLASGEAADWEGRLACAASMLQGCNTVADLGCGTMDLEKSLPPATKYIPVDLVARDGRTRIVDFNQDAAPGVCADAGVLLGLLEYVHDIGRLLRECRPCFKRLVLSYNCRQADGRLEDRRSHAWVNDLTEQGIEEMFRSSGWCVARKVDLGSHQWLWQLQPAQA
jgi:hypothetical protein